MSEPNWVAKVETYLKLRPRCGFCGKEIKELPSMSESGTTIFCCAECGAVLGVTKEEEK